MKNVTKSLVFLFLALVLFTQFGCGDEPMKQSFTTEELKIGDTTVCPVMGTKFKIKKDTKYALVDEKKYYVCCPACIDKIKNNPKKYLSGSSHEKKKEMEDMHKEHEETE